MGACGSVESFERAHYSGTPIGESRTWPAERVQEEALRDAAVSAQDERVVVVEVTDGLAKALARAGEELADADVVLVCEEGAAIALTRPDRPAPKIYATLAVPEPDASATLDDLVRAALSLYHRYLPPGPENAGVSCPWLCERDGAPLRTTVGELTLTGANTRDEIAPVDWHYATDVVLLPVCGKDTEDLIAAVTRVKEAVDEGADLADLVADDAEAPLRAVFSAKPDAMARELDRALTSLARAHAEGKDWASPNGSYCAVRPIGADGGVALVYPGLFTLYAGLSRELMRLFPVVHSALEALALDTGAVEHRDLVQRLLGRVAGPEDEAGLERELVNDLGALCAIGVGFTTAHTQLLRALLGRRDLGAVGYSLGEVSMIIAAQPDTRDFWALRSLGAMPVLDDGIAASDRVVRRKWEIPDSDPGPVWGSRVIMGDPERVRTAVRGRDRVFLSHVNTPGEVVITGDPTECAQVAAELGLPSIPSAHSHVFHTPLMERGYFESAFDQPVTVDPRVELFSAHENRPFAKGDRDLGDKIMTMLSRQVDFARVVRAAYVQGYRYFLEVGPGGVCTRWITDTLAGKPHVAVPLERRGAPAVNTVAGLVARLASNGVPLDLTPFLPVQKETT
ncbi:hypothetical protein NLX83_34990 [Allokutzneria sp. A3M-2-11 16]|uniref:hypothetical protein n=1 Tax=Allokutzneria sp. A3M-2-11 16 TaxID=2962043 RepID=UPI0020B8C771|nr:hypothetical protein [Allokutzneria sp. A3M-2-11 16]MCP3804488.1 hypothetical protein [Allokutzneria sp. A3M-2-11 16]